MNKKASLFGIFCAGILIGVCFYNILTIDRLYEDSQGGIHQSYTVNKEFYDDAYRGAQDRNAQDVGGVIVNHHLLAPHLIAEALHGIRSDQRRTIVLIAPNHFAQGNNFVTTSEYDWTTPFGTLPASDVVTRLVENKYVDVYEDAFIKEHGIYNIIAFIKKSFPNADVIPLMVKEVDAKKQLVDVIEFLNDILPEDTIFIGSFDFTHGATNEEAIANDKMSLEIIEQMDADRIKRVNIDSQNGLKMLMEIMRRMGYTTFDVLAQTNASQILQQPDMTDVTSYITGYFKK